MLKITIPTVLLVSFASAAIAQTQNIKVSSKAAHTLDFTHQGCYVEKAFFGDPSAAQSFDLNLDQPQPRTQKITLRWKADSKTDEVYLQLHLQGCSQDYAQVSLKRVDSPPSSPVTYINAPIAHTPAEQFSTPTARQTHPPVGVVPSQQQVAANQPLTLNLTRKASSSPKPKIIKRPPVRRLSLPNQSNTTANSGIKSNQTITSSSILKGLNIARNRGEIRYYSQMHHRVNGMIRAMRRGASAEAASRQAGVPASVVQALISYSQK
jgi:hypothetical protein